MKPVDLSMYLGDRVCLTNMVLLYLWTILYENSGIYVISDVRSLHVINAKTCPPGKTVFNSGTAIIWSDDPWLGISDRGAFHQFPTNSTLWIA